MTIGADVGGEIVGNVVICKEGMTPEGMDFVDMTDDDIKLLSAKYGLGV